MSGLVATLNRGLALAEGRYLAAVDQSGRVISSTDPSQLLAPAPAPPLARAELREAFSAIGRAQQQLNRFVPLGI